MNVTFKAQRLRYGFAPCVLLIVMLSAPSAFAQVVLGEDITQQGRILTVGGSASSTQNATDLTNALTEAAALTPSANNPVLIQLGPGLFDFGTIGTAIEMPDHVHLRGAGVGVSVLRCVCSTTVIWAIGTTNQFSHLTVENTGPSGRAISGINGANVVIDHAMTVARYGVEISGATTTAEITHSTLLSTAGTGDDALQLTNGAEVMVSHSRIDGNDSSNDGVVWGEGSSCILTIRHTFIGAPGVRDPWPGTATIVSVDVNGGVVAPSFAGDGSKLTNLNPDPPCFNTTTRFVDCGNGTVTDTEHGLILLKNVNCSGAVNWQTANQFAAGLEDGDCGLTDGSRPGDWRLLTKEEWENFLASVCSTFPKIVGNASPVVGCHSDTGWATGFAGGVTDFFWTATSRSDNTTAAHVASMSSGTIVGDSKSSVFIGNFRAWPVRSAGVHP